MTRSDHSADELDRRQYVKGLGALGAAGMAGFAGCSGDGGGGDGGDGSGDGGDGGGGDGGDGGGGGSDGELEVLHGWAGGDGEAAITALEEAFNEAHPDVDSLFQAASAGANVEINALVLRRLTNNNPPSSFANWPGKWMTRYEGRLMDLSEDVWEAEGLTDVIHDATVEACTIDGIKPAVPIGSHRMNNLFYNVAIFEEAGVDPDDLTDVSSMLDAFEQIAQNTDAAPMTNAQLNPFNNLQLWAQIITSEYGVDAYEAYIGGDPDRDAVVGALEPMVTINEEYNVGDASSLSFTESNQKLIAGEAATIHQGNWVYGMYRADDEFNYQEEWDWMAFPGTEDLYFFHLDSFIAPSDNPTPEDTVTWMKFVGSKEAQITFNNPKGSVPLRTDIDSSELTDFLQMTYEDLLEADRLPPTIAHGLAVTPDKFDACKEVFANNFSGPYDVEATADGLIDVVTE